METKLHAFEHEDGLVGAFDTFLDDPHRGPIASGEDRRSDDAFHVVGLKWTRFPPIVVVCHDFKLQIQILSPRQGLRFRLLSFVL
jgi:hypothetical protein